jgi:methyl-accepting chemotaxis protein
MLKGLPLATKLALGFGVVVGVAVVLGVTGYVMFSRVDSNVVALSAHSLPAVKHSTGVERGAFESILQEKKYLLEKKDEIHQAAKEKLAALNTSLDNVDKVAEQFKDSALATKSKDVRGIAGQYAQLFDDGVAALKGNREGETTMNTKGELVGSEASAYMASKKTEYLEGKDALAVVNRINALALETRMNEKGYMLYKEQKYFDVIEKNIAELLKSYDQLEKMHADATEQKQIADARKATQEYFEAAKAWVQTQKTTAADADTLQAKGKAVSEEARAYLDSKQKEYNQAKDELAMVNRIAIRAYMTRMYARIYMASNDETQAKKVEDTIVELLKAYDQLDKMSPTAEEQKQIAGARSATQSYSKAFKDWVAEHTRDANSAQLTELAKRMAEDGETVGKAADDYLASKEPEVEKVAQAVFKVASIDQCAYRIRLRERDYMLRQDEKTWAEMNQFLDELSQLYKDLRPLSSTKDDLERIDRAEKATQEYAAAAKSWVENDKQMKAGAGTMDTDGQTVGGAAAEYLTAKQGRIDKVADGVFIVADIAGEALTTRLNEKGYIINQDQKCWTGLNDHITKLTSLYGDLRKVSLTADDQQRIERAEKATGEYLTAAKSWVENDNKLRKEILPKMKEIGDNVITTAQTAENDAWKQSDERGASVTGIVSSSKLIIIGALLAGALIGCVAAFAITRSIATPLKNTFKGLKSCSTAELEETATTFNRIIDSMADGVSQVNDAAAQVSSASQQLAEGASEQASALEETSSALEQMAAMARTNATNSKEANDLAAQAHKAASDGEKTMIGINEASDKISKIIKVIEEIAFQTNLLALNAAVEAARAGEHGKGFAVVAEEVRNLAQRAAGAAKETTGLIEESVTKSREGKTAIQTIVGGVAKVTELINGISRASEEQAQGVDQVNTAVSQMDKVTQQNASGAEESASAAEELTAQAAATKGFVEELVTLVRGNDARLGTSSSGRARAGQKPPLTAEPHHGEFAHAAKRTKSARAANAAPALHGTTTAHDAAGALQSDSLKDF